MAITISLVGLFGVALVILLRTRHLGCGSAFVAAMFGFTLASTGAAALVNHLISAIVKAIQNL
ncbi:hypothetical protein ACF1FX_21955 [Streptomyces sp. NPDC014646]|uniref:hypothetical protein n=1 Tax=Streptomyces sp. NPDC014646 TaxID=3364877 RepID=UPI0036F9DB53